MTDATVPICPKCQGAMRTYERSGVAIDQCTDCRGIFLDHGELQRLMYAESMWMGRRDEPQAHERDRDSEPADAAIGANASPAWATTTGAGMTTEVAGSRANLAATAALPAPSRTQAAT